MATAKDIQLRPISAQDAREAVRRWHYSGKVVNNSQLHIGAFLGGTLEGAMQFGPSLDKRKIQPLVKGTPWNGFIELNRMAFSDRLPRNSESRALSVAFRLIRQHAPHIKWIISFADATQSGDGAIYRAVGFILTGIKENDQIWIAPEAGARESRTSLTDNRSKREQQRAQALSRVTATKGKHITHAWSLREPANSTVHTGTVRPGIGGIQAAAITNGASSMKAYVDAGFRPLDGYQLRYIYFLDPAYRERLTVPELPYSAIDEMGARMYRGFPIAPEALPVDASANHAGEGGSSPTPALH